MTKWSDNFILPNIKISSIEENNTIYYSPNNNEFIYLFSTISPIEIVDENITILYNAKILVTVNSIKKNTNFDIVIITKIDNQTENSSYLIKLKREIEFDTFQIDYITFICDNNDHIKFNKKTLEVEYLRKFNYKPIRLPPFLKTFIVDLMV
jgi:hypothetical protein